MLPPQTWTVAGLPSAKPAGHIRVSGMGAVDAHWPVPGSSTSTALVIPRLAVASVEPPAAYILPEAATRTCPHRGIGRSGPRTHAFVAGASMFVSPRSVELRPALLSPPAPHIL